jgi:hypothetical protein
MGAPFLLPLRHEGRHYFGAGELLKPLRPSPKYAAVPINPQAFEKKFISVGFLS